jgi:probable F420-dependent oxidoreductase
VHPFRFGVSVRSVTSRSQLQDLARRAEGQGFSTLCFADHLGLASMFPSIVSAAEATTTLRLATLVVNNDFQMPLRLAQDAATVDVLTGGRLELGLGSGWAKPEYEILGIPYQRPSVRGARLAEAVRTMKTAWAGEPRLAFGPIDLTAVPAPQQQPHPPLLIGGNSNVVLRLAAREADIVGLTGLAFPKGATEVDVSGFKPASVDERVAWVRSQAGERFDQLELNALVQRVIVTDDRQQAATELAAQWPVLSVDDVLQTPYALIGTVDQMAESLQACRRRWGLSYFVAHEWSLDAIAPVVARLVGT